MTPPDEPSLTETPAPISPAPPSAESEQTEAEPTLPPVPSVPFWKGIVVLVLAGAVGALCYGDRSMQQSTDSGVIMDLPSMMGSYIGEEQDMTEAERVILPKDTGFERRVYTDFLGNSVNCQIVLSSGDKRSIHRPEICLPGQGWTIQTGSTLPIQLEDGRELKVMHLVLSRPIEGNDGKSRKLQSHFLYWFVGKDRVTAKHLDRILLTSMDRILHDTNHRWAYVVVSAPITAGLMTGGQSSEEVLEMLKDFVRKMAPQILKPETLETLPRS